MALNTLIKATFICLLALVPQIANAQNKFVSCDPSEIESLIYDFGINAERLNSFGYLAEVCRERNYIAKQEPSQSLQYDVVAFEDRKSNSKRVDWMRYIGSQPVPLGGWSVFTVLKGKTLASIGDLPIVNEKGEFSPVGRSPVPEDPCMVAIAEPQLTTSGGAGKRDSWSELLDMKKMLWCETDGRLTRGEWTYGTGEHRAHIQVYFDKTQGGMPVLTRYILPKDYEKRFVRIGRRYCCDINTKWTNYNDGFVPARVECRIENYWGDNDLRTTENFSIGYVWKTSLVTAKGVNPDVFVHNKILSEELVETFKAK
ncbi:hypothetical protein VN12_22610 [Pirellula sp. SH-Sr6A]|uniref:hypothetical protein n=1 Tax=Pirellula sp. SH-Sr6A TaxID=1632865 RepID=UPI00078BCEBC|nr:hypothetical protein [Pirellula sp. SH-Sr6A]AMV34936.1 hypothetical protein VN12_22610 [Pirellula sp. SH-Sr6A]